MSLADKNPGPRLWMAEEGMEGDKADLPCCNLQAEEREITHLTSFFSPSAAARGTSLVVSAADIPLDPPPPAE